MAKVTPRGTKGGRSAAWLVKMELDSGGLLAGEPVTPSKYSFDWIETPKVSRAPRAGATATASGNTFNVVNTEGSTFVYDNNTETLDGITAEARSDGGSGGGNTNSPTMSIVSFSSDPDDDVEKLDDMMDGPVLVVIPHGKNFKAGAMSSTIRYHIGLGYITGAIETEFIGNGITKITVTVTCASFTSAAGDQSEVTGVTLTAIKPVGTDDSLAGVPAPTLSTIPAPKLTQLYSGRIIKI